MDMVKVVARCYFSFHYGIGCVLWGVILSLYLFGLRRRKMHFGQEISKKAVIWGIVLSLYLALLISGTILNRSMRDEYSVQLSPFWSYRELLKERDINLAIQIVNNILMFVPWGILFPTVFKSMQKVWCNIGSAFLFSFALETIQLIFKCGLFEIDDMFNNTLGAVVGYGIWRGVMLWKKWMKD